MFSVTILTKNSAHTIAEVLSALNVFPEVLVIDTGSQDETISIAKTFTNVKVLQMPFEGFGPTHNKASAAASSDWILSIDSDEVVTKALADEILNLSLDETTVYELRRQNFFNGKHIKWCGWDPEYVVRLYNRKKTGFSEALVHEKIETSNLKVKRLNAPLHHTPYGTLSDFLVKMERYSTLFAQQYKGKRKSSPTIAFWHACGAFLKSYIIKKGFLGGYEGFLISFYNCQTTYYKYLKLYHLT